MKILVDCETGCHEVDIMIIVCKNMLSFLLRDFEDQALWPFDIKCSDEHLLIRRADFHYEISSPHFLSLLVKHDSILIEHTCLSINYGKGLSQSFGFGSGADHRRAYRLVTHNRWLNTLIVG